MKGKLIQLKYHDDESLLKKAHGNKKNKLIVVLNIKNMKLAKEIREINKDFVLVVYEPDYKRDIEGKMVKVAKTMNELVQELELFVSKN